jgi:hypothetical protein
MRKKLLSLLRIATPLAVLFAGVASAQTTGTVIGVVTDASTGKPAAGAVVIATSPSLQGQQTAVTDNAGSFRITLLPPGDYSLTVQLGGYKDASRSDLTIRSDKTIRANMAVVPEAVQMEEQVVRTGTAPVVNVGSAESGAVVSKEFIATIPVTRGFDGIAIVAPTARVDFYGIAFAGAQSPENQYIIDGLNTTDPSLGTRAGRNGPPSLRSNFTDEIDVKTGAFGAEYGRATGGILNVVLKSGSNEYHGSVFSTFQPNNWVQPDGKPIGSAGQAIAYRETPGDGSYLLDFGGEVGGPILKDKLWFYAGFAPVIAQNAYTRYLRSNVMGPNCPEGSTPTTANNGDVHGLAGQCVDSLNRYLQDTIPGTNTKLTTNRTTYQWVGKLTYLLSENHSFTVTGWGAPSSRNALNSAFVASAFLYNAPSNQLIYTDDGQTSVFARYGGKFLDKKLLTEVQAGWYNTFTTPVNKTRAGVDQFSTPSLEWDVPVNVSQFESVPGGVCTSDAQCPVFGYTVGGRGGRFETDANRYAAKASAAYLFDGGGQHNVKGGIDLERLDYADTRAYSGNFYWTYDQADRTRDPGLRFRAIRGFGNILNRAPGAAGVDIANYDPTQVIPTQGRNRSETDSFGYFLQDSWQPSFVKNVTLNYGLRLETQSMKNLDFPDATGFKINDNWSPRVQAIWDFTGNGRGKVAGSWGRFYYAMPLDMGSRAFGGEVSLNLNLLPNTCGFGGTSYGTFDPRALGVPGTTAFGTNTACQLSDRTGANNDVRLTGGTLTPADSQLKGQFVDQFGGQVEYEVLSDLSVGLDYMGRRQGNVIEDMSSDDGNNYFIGNPGVNRDIKLPDGTVAGNSKFVTTTDPVTGRNVNIVFPSPERSFDGFTLKATKLFSKNWMAQASYTLSYLRGNYSGPYRPEDNQLDPGITSEYDLASLMSNKQGFLPGDQRHQLKLYGAYTFNFGPRFNVTASGAYTGLSGTPVNALGAHPIYGSSQAFIIPRGQGGRTPFLNTVDIGGALGYVVRPPYAINFRVDIFNIFNSQEAQLFDEDYTFDTVVPMANASCKSKSAAGKANPVASLQSDCPDLAFLKTADGRPVSPNPNWGRAQPTTTAFQTPLSMRLSVAITF